MIQVRFYDEAEDGLLKFAVILAKSRGKYILCRHRSRDTYELPQPELIAEARRRGFA